MGSVALDPSRAQSPPPGRGGALLDVDGQQLARCFDRESFSLGHHFAENELFRSNRLAALAEALGPLGLVTHHAGTAQVDDGWDGLARRSKRVESVLEAIEQLSVAGAWIKITQLQRDPEYAALLDQLIREIDAFVSQDLARDITRMCATLFVSSPGAVTPYHADHETNFLFQLRGRKLFRVFDPADPEVMSPAEVEYFNLSGSVEYHDSAERKALTHSLAPGVGAHNPSGWPHWAKTLDEPSVSLSVNFCLRERDLRARVYQCNYFLRRAGIAPKPPGQSAVSDAVKKLALSTVWRIRRVKSVDELVRGHLRPIRGLVKACRYVGRVFRR